ncbi:MAG TPA: hypothetical protein VMT28_01065 [Terriglobales bacterium]|jgi:hypothetical protein|nr:hypothetical protein [Terriglobales bacterium]
MGGFFTRERFGRPQFLAGLLLFVFLVQCGWLVERRLQRNLGEQGEAFRIHAGIRQWTGGPVAGTPANGADAPLEVERNSGYDPNHSALWYLVAGAPFLLSRNALEGSNPAARVWLSSAPYLLFGLLLGGSLWYVSRRLYGNAGGYTALVLYCFSPGMLRASAGWLAQPEVGAAWGAFGAIFTAIAVAHTLYAPREVVLWNWRRILLLGFSLTLAVGSQFSLLIVVPIALAFMLYLAPTRRMAALAIWAASCGLTLALLAAAYCFHARLFWEAIQLAHFFESTWQALGMSGACTELLAELAAISPALTLAAPAALVVYLAWPRTRYFGITAPLLVAFLFLLLGLLAPHYPGLGFRLMAVPFLFVFIAGVSADLLETSYRNLVQACLWGLLLAYALWNLMAVARVGRA